MNKQERSAVTEFRESLAKYEQERHFSRLLEAVRVSYLTAGYLPPELSGVDESILQQLGIGWPYLTDQGNAIGRELIRDNIRLSSEALQKLASEYPPRALALFVVAAGRGTNIFSLRIPKEPQDSDNMGYVSSLSELISHRKIQPYIVRLGQDLVKHNLAINYSAPAYKGAKWHAVFIHFPWKLLRN